MAHHHSQVLIIGSGPAGYTAAIYASRAGLKPRMVRGMVPGGQMTTTTDVENYPGFADVVQGPWLMGQMEGQARSVGTDMVEDLITSVDLSQRPFKAVGDSADTYSGNALIITTGAQARWLGLESEEQFKGFGVSACATCDGFFYKDQQVAVIGGGNTAAEEAMFLTNFASKVTLVHRRGELRAEKILQDRLLANSKIEVMWDSVLEEVIGAGDPMGVTGAKIKNVKSGEITEIPVHGVFIAIGHTPATELFNGQLNMDDEGYLNTAADSTRTNIPGVFAAGDVQDKIYRQAVTAAGTGCMAALEAQQFLAEAVVDEAQAAE